MSDSLRDFRRSVSILKKRGLLPTRTSRGNKLDARSAQPNWKAPNGKSLASIVKKYDDVLSGKVTPLKVSPERIKQFRKAGYQTSQGRVMVPHTTTERAVVRKGEVVIKSTTGIERIQIPIEYHNLEQYLRDIAKDAPRINRMKRDSEYFGFKFFGNNSSSLYSDIEFAIEDISKYEAVMQADTKFKQREVYKNLEIVRIGPKSPWVFPSERRKESSKKYNRERMKRFRRKLKRKPEHIREEYAEKRRARQREYRARIKKDSKRYKAYRKAASKRELKSRTKKQKAKKKRTNHAKNRRTRS